MFRPSTSILALFALGCSSGLTPIDYDTGIGVDDPDTDRADTGDTDLVETGDTGVDNSAPTADAGADIVGNVGDIVQLDGSNSTDPDGDELDYAWSLTTLPAGSGTQLLNASSAEPSFYLDRPGTYVVQLTVDDGLLTDSDELQVTVEAPDEIPVADAGLDQSVMEGATVQLNGTGSFDPEGEPLAYTWAIINKPAGSGASLDNPSAPMPVFVADLSGTYRIELIVSDGVNDSLPDQAQITAEGASDGDCLSCSAAARQAVRDRLTLGDATSGPGLILLPLLVLFWQRKRE